MENQNKRPFANHHISVDCVVLGFDGSQLNALLIRRVGVENGEQFHDMKLPGSLIFKDENLDEAAMRVLGELTGLKSVKLQQFKAFGSKDRTKNPKDVHWLEHIVKEQIDSIITIAYFSLVKLNRTLVRTLDQTQTVWVPVDEIPPLAFDHNIIIREVLVHIRQFLLSNPDQMFELLPRKFTAAQLRQLYEVVYLKKLDVRNFHKKMTMMDYVVPLDEYEQGVSHRAARYYHFDRKIYNKRKY